MTSPKDIIQYRTVQSLNMELVYEKNNRSLAFCGSRKMPTLGSTVQWETSQASFPTGTLDPQVGIFGSPLNTNDVFYIYLTYLYQPVGKIKKPEQPHAGHTSMPDVSVMFKYRHPVASVGNSGFSGIIFHVFSKIK